MNDASRLDKILETECPTVWIRLLRYRRPKHWDNIDDSIYPLKRNLCGHPLAGLLVGKKIGRGRIARR